VAIYESLRFDFNLPRAATLALLQITVIVIFFLAIESIAPRGAEAQAQAGAIERGDAQSIATRALDALALALVFFIVAGPVVGAIISAASGKFWLILADPAFRRALIGSLAIALPAGLLSAGLAVAIAYGAAHLQITQRRPGAARVLGASASALLIVPPFALAAGLFIALRPLADPAVLAMPLVALVNALTALPIALRIVGPPVLMNAERHGRLAASLGVSGLSRLRLIDAPLLRAPFGLALATVIAFSIGDLGVAALFGMGDTMTLPLYVYSLIGAYRMDQGGAAALLLCALILALFLGIERLARGRRIHV
jgi:thiamine transport system permease protein